MAGMLEEIDSWTRQIWLEVVKKEYDSSRILEESNLHSTVYFHLRKFKGSSTVLFFELNSNMNRRLANANGVRLL